MNNVIEEIRRINVLARRWRDRALDQEYKGHYYAMNVGCYKQAFSMIRNICKIQGNYPNAAPPKNMPWSTIHDDHSIVLQFNRFPAGVSCGPGKN